MPSEIIFFVNCFITLLSILDPFGASAILLSLTAAQDEAQRNQVVARTIKATVAILVVFALAGGVIFAAFGISISALMVGGGLILGNLGFKMILGMDVMERKIETGNAVASAPDDVAIIPLAMPLLAGPAAISSVTVFAHRAAGSLEYSLLFAAIALASALSYFILRNTLWIAATMGYNGMRVMIRVMGLILLAMGAEFVMGGVKAYFL